MRAAKFAKEKEPFLTVECSLLANIARHFVKISFFYQCSLCFLINITANYKNKNKNWTSGALGLASDYSYKILRPTCAVHSPSHRTHTYTHIQTDNLVSFISIDGIRNRKIPSLPIIKSAVRKITNLFWKFRKILAVRKMFWNNLYRLIEYLIYTTAHCPIWCCNVILECN